MAGIFGNVPVQVSKINEVQSAGLTILDYLFQKNAIILNDLLTIMTGGANLNALGGIGVNIPLPLLGFEFKTPHEVELLKYSYSEYPYVSKTLVTNAYMRENTNVSVVGYKPITAGTVSGSLSAVQNFSTSVVGNYLTNELIVSSLKMYCDKGGTFTLLTMWGQLQNLVLKRLSGVPLPDENSFGGQGFLFEFEQINFPKTKLQALKTILSKMTLGVL